MTLTTGTPLMNGGSLGGYAVRRGLVTIGGKGLDASQTDYTAILARAVQVNAGIWAKELRVVTGANQIDAAHNVTGAASAEGTGPTYALDVAALGGMYAGKIMLIGTEAGLGVRNAGTLAASSGVLVLDANGWLSNSGTLQGAGKLTLGAAGDVANGGTVRAGADAQLTAGGNIANSGAISAAGSLAVRGEGAQSRIDTGAGSLLAAGLNGDGSLGTAGALEVRAADALTIQGSALAGGASTLAGKTLAVTGATLNAGAMVLAASGGDLDLKGTHIAVAGQLDLSAAGALRTDAATVGAGQMSFAAASLSNVGGEIAQSGSGDLAIRLPGQIDNTGGRIAANSGNLTLDAQALVNAGGSVSHAGSGTLAIRAGRVDDQGGTIASNGTLDLSTGVFDHRGAHTSAAQLAIHADTLDNSGGTIAQSGAGQGSLALNQGMNNAGGAITSGGSLALSAAALDNRQGRVSALAAADLTLAGAIDNSGGSLAAGTLALHAGDLRNAAGTVQAVNGDGSLVVGALDNTGGSIAAAADLRTSAASLANSGSLYAGANQALTVSGGISNSGMIAAQGDTAVTAGSLAGSAESLLGAGLHADGSLAAGGALRVTTSGALAVQGQVHAAGAAALSGAALDLSHSQVQAGDVTLTASTGSVDTSAAQLTAGGTLAISADAVAGRGWRNTGGQVQAGQLALQANFLDNSGGTIDQLGGGDTALQLAGPASLLNNSGGRIAAAGANLDLRADTVLNAGGKLEHLGGGKLALQAGRLDNTAGLMRSAGSLTLDAGGVANHTGEISAGADLLASIEGGLDSDGMLYAGRGLTLDVGGTLDNAGSIAAHGDAIITAGRVHSGGLLGAGLDAQGQLAGAGVLSVTASGDLATSGRNVAADSLRLQGATLDLAGSSATAADIVLAAGAAIDTRGAGLHAGDTLAIRGGDLHNGGGQLSARALDVEVAALDNAAGAILQAGQGSLELRTVAIDNSAGRIAGDGTVAIQAGSVGNAGGTVAGAQGVTLNAADVVNKDGQIRSAAGSVALAVRDLENEGGAVFAGADLATSARDVGNSGSLYAAGTHKLAASGTVYNSGVIAAGGDTAITAASLANSHVLGAGLSADGVLSGSGSLTVATSGTLQSDGRNLAAGSASLAGAALDLKGSETTAANIALAARAGGIDTGDALVSTAGTLSASAPGTLANHGGVLSAGQLDLRVGAIDNATGTILQTGAGDTAIRTGILDNTGGRLAVNSLNLSVQADALRNAGGRLEHAGSGALLVQAGPVDNRAGRIGSAGSAAITANGAFDNTDGTTNAAGGLHLMAGAIDNSGGLLRAAGGTLAVDGASLLNLDGELSAGGDLRVKLAGDLRSDGLLYAGGAQSIQLGGTLSNSGAIASLGDTTIVADSVASSGLLGAGLDENGDVRANGELDVTALATVAGGQNIAGGDLHVTGGAIDLSHSDTTAARVTLDAGGADLATRGAVVTASGKLALKGGRVDNAGGQLEGGSVSIDAADVDNSGGDIRAASAGVTLAVRDLNNDAGTIFAGGDLATTARNIANSGSMYAGGNQTVTASGTLNSSGVLAAQGNATFAAAGVASSGLLGAGVRADGTLAASGDLSVSGSGTVQAGGSNLAAGKVSLSGATLDVAGSETSGTGVRLSAGAGQVDTSRALVTATGTLGVDARAGNLVNAGGALSAGQLDLQAAGIRNAGGTILQTGGGDTVIDTGALDNTGGRLAVNSRNLHIGAATLDNAGGRIEHAGTGTLDLDAGTLGNAGGRIISSGAAVIGASASLDNLNGVIAAATDLGIRGGAIANGGGLLQAKTGGLTLDAASFANGSGEASAGGAMRLGTGGDLTSEGLLYAGAALALDVGGTLRSSGSIAALGDTVIDAGSVQSSGLLAAGVKADGSLATGGNLRVSSGQALVATGQNVAAGDAALQGARIDLSGGETSAANLTIATTGDIDTGSDALVKATGTLAVNAAGTLHNAGGSLGAGKVTLNVASLDNRAGDIVQTGAGDLRVHLAALDNSGGRIAAAGGLDVAATTLVNTGGELRAAGGNATLAADSIVNGSGGSVYAAANLDTRTGTFANSGSLYAAGNQTLTASGAVANDGTIAAQGDTTIAAASLSGDAHALLGAGMRADGTLLSSGTLRVDTQGLAQARGQNLAGGDLAIHGSAVDLADSRTGAANVALSAANGDVATSGAQVSTAGTLAISAGGALVNSGGVLSAGQLAIAAAGIDNSQGTIAQSGSGDTLLAAGTLNNNEGWIGANSANLRIDTATLANAGGTIQHAGSGTLTVRAGTIDNTAGHIHSGAAGDVAATASLRNQDGVIAGTGGLRIGGGALDNGNGLMRATSGNLTLDAASLASGGEVSAGGDLRLSVSSDLANDGLLYAGGNQTLDAGGVLRGAGSAAALGNLDVHAGRIDTSGLFGAGMRSDGSLAVSGAGDLSITSSGNLKAGGDKLAAGSVALRGMGIDLSHAYTSDAARPLTAGTRITVDAGAGAIDTSGAILSTGGDLTLTGAALANRHGELGGAQVALAVSTLDNAGGVIVQNGAGDMRVAVNALDNTGGRITAVNGSLGLSAASIDNSQGMLAAAGSLRVEGGADLVNEGGKIQGVAGDVSLQVRDLRNDGGSVFAGHDLSTSARNVDNDGSLFAGGSQTLSASGSVGGEGVIAAQGDVTLNAASLAAGAGSLLGAGIRADGSLGASGKLAVTTAGALQASGQVLAGGNAELSGTGLDLGGSQASAANMALTASSGNIDTRGATVTTGTLVLNASGNSGQTWNNVGGDVQANQLQAQVANLANTAGKIVQLGNGDAVLSTTGNLDNSAGGSIKVNSNNLTLRASVLSNAGGTIEHFGNGRLAIEAGRFDGHDGNITGNGSLSLRATDIDHRNGQLSAEQLVIDAATLDNSLAGDIVQRGTGQASVTVTNGLNNAGGRIGSNGNAAIVAGTLNNGAGGLLQAGGSANLNLNVGGLLANGGGQIIVGGNAVVTAGSVDNRGGSATAAGGMTLDTGGQLWNTGGMLAAAGDLAVTGANLDNSGGQLASVNGNLTLGSTGAIANSGGKIQAAGAVGIGSVGMANGAGGVVSGHDITLDTRGQGLDNVQGTIAATGAAVLQTGALNNDGGRIQSETSLLIDTHGQQLTNTNAAAYATVKPDNTGGITGGTATALYTGNLDNTGGFLASAGQLTGSTSYLTNARGEIAGLAGISFTIGGLNNQSGSVQALGSLAFNAGGGTIDNVSGLLRAGQTQALTLSAGAIDNRATQGAEQGIEGGDLSLTTASLSNSGGALRANNNATISSAGSVGNGGGLMSAMNSLSIQDAGAGRALAVDNSGGTLIGGKSTAIRAASLGGVGRVLSQNDMTIDLAGGYALEAGSELIANRNVTLNLGGGLSNAGKLQAGGTLALTAASVDNTAIGDINAGNTRINSGSLTNRGVIDGINTDIDTGTLTNVGTGRIYGDRIGIAAGSVVNDVENGVAGTIAARGNLALGASSISNREHALIFSGGDMAIGSGLNESRDAYGSASSVTNASAHIEALGSMVLTAGSINVVNNHFSSTSSFDGTEVNINEYDANGKRYAVGAAGVSTKLSQGNRYLTTPDGRFNNFEQYQIVRTTGTTVVTSSDPGLIAAGTDLTIHAGAILNDNSQIVAGRTLSVPAQNIENRSTASQTVIRETVTVTSYDWTDIPVDRNNPYFEINHPTSTYTTETVVGNGTSTPYEWTKSAVPGVRSGVTVSGTTSAAGAVTAGRADYAAVAGPSGVSSVGLATGKVASAVSGSATGITAHIGEIAQAGPAESQVRVAESAALAPMADAGSIQTVESAESVHATGAIATPNSTPINTGSGSLSQVELGDRKNAGQAGSVGGVGGVGGAAAIAGALGGANAGQPADGPTKAALGTRKAAGTDAVVNGASAGSALGAIANAVAETKVSDGVAVVQTGTPLAGANGSSLAPATTGAATGPTPGTDRPNVRGIVEIPLAVATANAEVVRTNTLPPVVPNASLYQISPAPEAAYLVETDPRFADYRQWTSADYLTAKVPTDPSVTQKRLGDGFYEQQLVREQMTALTGYRYSGDYTNDEAQYRGLMDAAASFASTWNLRPGVALTPAQMASLTSDIVWLVEQDVTLADGSTEKVLVPQVYVRLREGDLDGSGALLSGKNVDIALGGDLTNSGTIAGRDVVTISAENIENLSGRIHGDNVTVDARQDLNNISATISANSALTVTAGRDLNIATGVATLDRGSNGVASALGRVAGLYVTGGEGTLLASAGRDLNIAGGIVSNNALGGQTEVKAAGNLNVYQTVATTTSLATGATPISEVTNSALSAAGGMTLKAGTDLNITGSSVSATDALIASAGRDITLRTTTSSTASQSGKVSMAGTNIDAVAGLSVTGTGAGSTLQLTAGRDINLTAAEISNAGVGGITALTALRDLNLGTVGISARDDTIKNANNYRLENSTSEVGTVINGAGSVLLDAGNNLTVRAGEVDAGTALTAKAGNDIDITTGTATYSLDQSSQTTKSGFMSKKVTTKRDTVDTVTSIASTLTGGTVSMTAGNNLDITGSAVVGDDAVKLSAAKDINIAAAVDTNTEWNHVEEKKSGFLTGGGGFGISYGTRTTTTDQTRDAVTQSGQARSMVGSIGGDLSLDAGNAIKVSGTDMSAGQDMSLAGKDVTIDAGKDQIDSKLETRVVQDALTLKVGGSIVNAIQSVQSVQQTAQVTDNKRVQAMAAATAAMAVKDDIAQNGFSVSLSLTAGHSESVQTTTSSETLHTGSALTAGQDISVIAKGEDGSGNINVIASDINAGRNVTLAATNQVNLVAAQDLESQHSESKSISAEAGVGVSYSTKNGPAMGFTATVSASKGHDDGEGTTQVNSNVNAAQTLTIVSGGDTNIKGAVASANQVVANVGGSLNLESLQDTAKFDSKTQSASVSGTYGYGASVSASVSQTTIKSDYASVQEQSGIKAGDGGFQISVGGNTDLKGAVISSTEAGTAANSLTTSTLTHSEIENYSKMQASSIGLSGSVTSSGGNEKEDQEKRNAGQNPAAGKGPGGINLVDVAATNSTGASPSATAISDNDQSTTKSGISTGAITITGGGSQSAGLDRTVLTGTDTSGRIDNNFNAAATQTSLQVTQQFTQTVVAAAAPVAAKLVGDIAGIKAAEAKAAAKNLDQLASAAGEAGNTSAQKDYEEQAKAARITEAGWGDDGVYRLALHATAQGAIGSMAGGSAGAVSGVAGVVGGNLGKQVGKFLADAQAEGLSEAERKELVNTYQQTMATLGGAVAGMAAGSGTSGAEMLANAMQSGTTGMTVDVNNRQLHEKETAWIRENAASFAEQMKITPEEAAKRLAQQAAKDTDLIWRALLPTPTDADAQAFLKNADKLTFTNSDGKEQGLFTTQGLQFMAPQVGALSADQSFIDQYLKRNGSHFPLSNTAEEIAKIGKAAGSAVINDPTGVLKGAFGGIVESLVNVAEHPADAVLDKLSSIESGTKTFAEGLAVSVDSTSKDYLNNLYGRDVSGAVSLTTIYQGVSAVSEVADVVAAAKLASLLGKGVADTAAKALVRNEVHAVEGVLDKVVPTVQVDIDRPNLGNPSHETSSEVIGSITDKTKGPDSGFPKISEEGVLPAQLTGVQHAQPAEIAQPHSIPNNEPKSVSGKEQSSTVDAVSEPATPVVKSFANRVPDEKFSIEPVPILSAEQALRTPGKILYVVKEDGKLVIARTNSDNLFGHFDLANGENILAGGEGRIYSGQVKSLDNATGHYLVEGDSARDTAVNAFRNAGFKVDDSAYVEKVYDFTLGKWMPK